MGSAGRKLNKKITDIDMMLALEKYIEKYENEKVNIKKLSEVSGIDRHYWYCRKGFKEKIDSINNISYEEYGIISEEEMKKIKLPNVDELVDNYFKNKKALKNSLNSFFLTFQELYEISIKSYKMKKEINFLNNEIMKLEEKNKKLKEEKKRYKELSEYYENRYYEIAVRSREKNFRKENNINNNVIQINNNNKAYSTTEDDLDSLLNLIDDYNKG